MHATWPENMRAALGTIRAHKLRAGLTMLGVLIGVMSVISVAAIIHGLNQHIADKVNELGGKTFIVTRFRLSGPPLPETWPEKIRLRKHFTYEDAVALREQCRTCVIATPMLTRAFFFGHRNEIRFRNQTVDDPLVRGAEPSMAQEIGRAHV